MIAVDSTPEADPSDNRDARPDEFLSALLGNLKSADEKAEPATRQDDALDQEHREIESLRSELSGLRDRISPATVRIDPARYGPRGPIDGISGEFNKYRSHDSGRNLRAMRQQSNRVNFAEHSVFVGLICTLVIVPLPFGADRPWAFTCWPSWLARYSLSGASLQR